MGNIPFGFQDAILIAIVLVLSWLALNAKSLFFRRIKKRRLEGKHTIDSSTAHILNKILSISIFFVALMIVLQVLGLNIVPLLTVSGIGAAILGFASKDMFANFFGGFMIYLTRPFSVDDQIEIPSKGIHGYIEEIGWYLTQIRDLSKKLLYIPNSVFSTEMLINYSRMTHRRIYEKIRISPKDVANISGMVQEINGYLRKHHGIDQKELINVSVISVNPWGVIIEIKAYTKTTNYLEFCQVKQEVLLEASRKAYQ